MRVGAPQNETIVLLSRNNAQKILCSQCGKKEAEWIDPLNYYNEKPFWCEECLRKTITEGDETEEDEIEDWDFPEDFLRVCNSPRMGVCGYEGSDRYQDQFEPDEE